MALTAQGWQLVVQLIDKGGNKTTRTFDYIDTDSSGDMSALASQAASHLADLAAVSYLVPVKYSINKVFVEDALTLPTDNGAEIEAHALITAPIDGVANKSATIDIPGPQASIFVDTSGAGFNVVDTANSDLLGYIRNFKNNGAGGLFFISDGENILEANLKGKRTHSHSTKG